jgi:hypothetical protein
VTTEVRGEHQQALLGSLGEDPVTGRVRLDDILIEATRRVDVAHQQTLRSIDHPDQTLVTHTAPAGSPAPEALKLLAQLAGSAPAATRGLLATRRPLVE